ELIDQAMKVGVAADLVSSVADALYKIATVLGQPSYSEKGGLRLRLIQEPKNDFRVLHNTGLRRLPGLGIVVGSTHLANVKPLLQVDTEGVHDVVGETGTHCAHGKAGTM